MRVEVETSWRLARKTSMQGTLTDQIRAPGRFINGSNRGSSSNWRQSPAETVVHKPSNVHSNGASSSGRPCFAFSRTFRRKSPHVSLKPGPSPALQGFIHPRCRMLPIHSRGWSKWWSWLVFEASRKKTGIVCLTPYFEKSPLKGSQERQIHCSFSVSLSKTKLALLGLILFSQSG